MKRNVNIIQVLLFLGIIFSSLILKGIGIDPSSENFENTSPKLEPNLSFNNITAENSLLENGEYLYAELVTYKDEFNSNYKENFEFKNQFFKLYSTVESDLLHTNPLPSSVVKGSNGFYFLGDSYSNAIKESKGIINFSEKRLRLLLNTIEEHDHWATQQGIQYYLAVAPNKLSVYNYELPIVASEKKTKLNQLKDRALLQNLPFIDMGDLFEASENRQLYYKTDSHWNDQGAYLGYHRLIETFQKQFPTATLIPLSYFDIKTEKSKTEDLTKMLQLKTGEETTIYTYRDPERAIKQPPIYSTPSLYRGKKDSYEIRYKSPVNEIKILFFRDSFFTGMEKYVKESFGNVVLIWSPKFDKALIEKEKPDIVVQEIAERNLEYLFE